MKTPQVFGVFSIDLRIKGPKIGIKMQKPPPRWQVSGDERKNIYCVS